jgi:hypothetical protein
MAVGIQIDSKNGNVVLEINYWLVIFLNSKTNLAELARLVFELGVL